MKKNISNTRKLSRKSVCISIALAVLLCTPPLAQSADSGGRKEFAELENVKTQYEGGDTLIEVTFGDGPTSELLKLYTNGDFAYHAEGVDEGTWNYEGGLLKLFSNNNLFRLYKVEEKEGGIDLFDVELSDHAADLLARLEELRVKIELLGANRDDYIGLLDVERAGKNHAEQEAKNALAQAAASKKAADAALAQAAASKITADDALAITAVSKKAADAALAQAAASKKEADTALAQVADEKNRTKGALAQAAASKKAADAALAQAAASKKATDAALAQAAAKKKETDAALAQAVAVENEANSTVALLIKQVKGLTDLVDQNLPQGPVDADEKKAKDAAELKAHADGMAAGGQFLNLVPQAQGNPSPTRDITRPSDKARLKDLRDPVKRSVINYQNSGEWVAAGGLRKMRYGQSDGYPAGFPKGVTSSAAAANATIQTTNPHPVGTSDHERVGHLLPGSSFPGRTYVGVAGSGRDEINKNDPGKILGPTSAGPRVGTRVNLDTIPRQFQPGYLSTKSGLNAQGTYVPEFNPGYSSLQKSYQKNYSPATRPAGMNTAYNNSYYGGTSFTKPTPSDTYKLPNYNKPTTTYSGNQKTTTRFSSTTGNKLVPVTSPRYSPPSYSPPRYSPPSYSAPRNNYSYRW